MLSSALGLLAVAAPEPAAGDGIEAQLLRDIAALEALARDELPDGVPVQSLFEVDLASEADVGRRIASLRRSIAASEVDLAAMRTPDATAADSPDAGFAGRRRPRGGGPGARGASGRRRSEFGDPARAGLDPAPPTAGAAAAGPKGPAATRRRTVVSWTPRPRR